MLFFKYFALTSAVFCVLSSASNASKAKEEIEKEIWDQPLRISTFAGLTLASLGTKRSLIYENAGVAMQNRPALHPYNPVDKLIGAYPYMPVAAKIPLVKVFDRIPPLFQKRVLSLGKTPCDFSISIESFPWASKTRILYRPQYWMWPNARPKMKGTLKELVTLIALGSGIKGGVLKSQKVVSAHGPRYTILSGNSLCLGTAEDLINKPLWTFVTASPKTKKMRSTITLHLPITNLQLRSIQRMVPEEWMMKLAPQLVKKSTFRSLYLDMVLSKSFSGSPLLAPLHLLMDKKVIKKKAEEKKIG